MTDRSLINLAVPLAAARGSRLLSLALCVAMLLTGWYWLDPVISIVIAHSTGTW